MKVSAQFNYIQCQQKGFFDPKIIIGGVIALIIIFFLATGSFKFSASINPNKSTTPISQENASQENPRQETTPQPTSKPKTYQNDANGFSLEYPANWELKENPAQGYIAGVISPKESTSDTYQENLLIKAISTSSQPNITLQQLADSWENQTTKAESSLTIIDRKDTTLGGGETKSFTYTFKSEGDSGKGMAQITLKNNKAYVFQFNALEKDFNNYLPTIETILSTVKF